MSHGSNPLFHSVYALTGYTLLKLRFFAVVRPRAPRSPFLSSIILRLAHVFRLESDIVSGEPAYNLVTLNVGFGLQVSSFPINSGRPGGGFLGLVVAARSIAPNFLYEADHATDDKAELPGRRVHAGHIGLHPPGSWRSALRPSLAYESAYSSSLQKQSKSKLGGSTPKKKLALATTNLSTKNLCLINVC